MDSLRLMYFVAGALALAIILTNRRDRDDDLNADDKLKLK